jgi:hypothetical protein
MSIVIEPETAPNSEDRTMVMIYEHNLLRAPTGRKHLKSFLAIQVVIPSGIHPRVELLSQAPSIFLIHPSYISSNIHRAAPISNLLSKPLPIPLPPTACFIVLHSIMHGMGCSNLYASCAFDNGSFGAPASLRNDS